MPPPVVTQPPLRANREDPNAWRTFDPESVRNKEGGIHHGASAVQNLRAIGEDVIHVLPGERIYFYTQAFSKTWGPAAGIAGFFVGLLYELGEIAMAIPMLIVNLAQAALHGLAFLSNKAVGKTDGTADPVDQPKFYWLDHASGYRQIAGLISEDGRKRLSPLTSPSNVGFSPRSGGQ